MSLFLLKWREPHVAENHFGGHTDGISSSAKSLSQIPPYAGQEVRDIESLSDKMFNRFEMARVKLLVGWQSRQN
jgi:hypothetical protein